MEHFLNGEPIPSPQDGFDAERRAQDGLTADIVHAALFSLLEASAPAVLAVGPGGRAVAVPDGEEIVAIIEAVTESEIAPLVDDTVAVESLMEPPAPVEVVGRGGLPLLDVTTLELDNGALVILKPTLISENLVVFGGSSVGGVAVLDDDRVPEAGLIVDIVTQSGVGDLDQVALDRLLADELVELSFAIDEITEGMFGRASTEDLEILLQLVHLYMTAPRADIAARDAVVGQIRPFASDPTSIPNLAITVELLDARYGDDPRYRALPSLNDLDAFDLDRALATFVDRFDDGGDFVFVFSGDFEPDVVEDLARRYLGSLPAGQDDPLIDAQPDPPPGVVDRTVTVGTDAQGSMTILWTAEIEVDQVSRMQARVLALIVQARMRDRLREALAATYSPVVFIDTPDVPASLIETFIQISGDPERLEEISIETRAALAEIAEHGPLDDELDTAQEQLRPRVRVVQQRILDRYADLLRRTARRGSPRCHQAYRYRRRDHRGRCGRLCRRCLSSRPLHRGAPGPGGVIVNHPVSMTRGRTARGCPTLSDMADVFMPFALERYMSVFEQGVEINLSESGVHPVTFGELLGMAPDSMDALMSVDLNYPHVEGIPLLA